MLYVVAIFDLFGDNRLCITVVNATFDLGEFSTGIDNVMMRNEDIILKLNSH